MAFATVTRCSCIASSNADCVFGEALYIRTSGSRLLERVDLHKIIVEVDDMSHVEETAAAIQAMLKRFHADEDYHVSIPVALLRQAEASKRTFNVVLGSIAGISLLVGGIGIMNIMLVSVTERTREIGIMKAVGGRNGQIMGVYYIMVLIYSLLALAAGLSMVLSLQNRMLHNHHPGGWLKRLPPLQVMEKLLFDAILAGFIGLTLALLSGFVFLENLFDQHLAHKTILSIIAWLVFAILLVGRFTLGWRGRIAIRWTLGGFISLMLAYFGSKFVLEFIL